MVAGLVSLVEWARAVRPSERLIAFLSPFDEKSADATRVAPLQVAALSEMIRNEPLLAQRVDVRALRFPLEVAGAVRLLRWTRGHACLSGEVRTAGGKARWGPLVVRALSWATGVASHSRVRLGPLRLHPARADQMGIDAGLPVFVFTEKDIVTDHARGVRAGLLLLVAGELLPRGSTEEQRCRAAAKKGADALPRLLRALLLILDTDAPEAKSPGDCAARRARKLAAQAGLADAEHPYLWHEVTSLFTLAEIEGASRPSERLPFARRAAESAPGEARAAFGLGTALVATAEEQLLEKGDVEGAKRLCAEALPALEAALKSVAVIFARR